MTILNIIKQDTTLELEGYKIHESVLQSYHTVNYVYEMAKRGDSTTTIIDVIDLIRDLNSQKPKIEP